MKLILLILSYFAFGEAFQNEGCLMKKYGKDKIVCVCNSEHCDYFLPQPTSDKINLITSTKNGARYLETFQNADEKPNSYDNIVVIDRSKKYQAIKGFGGALTDAAGINIKSLPDDVADHLMKSYFSGSGSKYNLCRVPMGGTDFSTRGYSYDDGPVDKNLDNFKLAPEDFEYKVPLMKTALKLNDELRFFTATWTAPKWMKTNGQYYGKGGYLRKEYYETWANYFVKFLKAYKELGFDFWAITTGNEPLLAKLPLVKINSVAWEAESASLWVREHLGPALRNSEFADIKLMGIDDQRSFYPGYVSRLMKNETTRNYIDGFSVHWYLDTRVSPTALSQVHEMFPNKFIFLAEASNGFWPWDKHVDIGSWERGENYARDIIENLNHWVTAWVDWNLALDLNGGPTFINNVIDSAILVNTTAGEFYKQPMYYAIGHFSKFVPRNSVRIDLSQEIDNVPMIAFERPDPDNDTVIVLMNKSNGQKNVTFQDGSNYINLNLEGRSITTVLYNQRKIQNKHL